MPAGRPEHPDLAADFCAAAGSRAGDWNGCQTGPEGMQLRIGNEIRTIHSPGGGSALDLGGVRLAITARARWP